ncbi:Beta-1 3-galactosyl-O-glycosyl-glycoprotein beta-1 6-N-acetylglucosaminyltransferase [Paragonimus heterotremus]|uniref:Beta-1 3-galactosyl-O-glycosyl-glycoprotein beta-1 6-N-acetylglucosaminyltransferase n=1 Tax=Paragonimus heterotremus TaxID=100268 RepID=A0A8J4SVP2_9TREM|nr:Beta-1 3-galactosyl-O-glycosyl-glycoprotein beta-1 6-N-acetylglucosaminyltransferase [Paragonimus heterotremus]
MANMIDTLCQASYTKRISLIIVPLLICACILRLASLTEKEIILEHRNRKSRHRPNDADFPIAFSIRASKDADRIAKLLQTIYRPHNYYCIHPNAGSSAEFKAEVLKTTSQFGKNVYIVPDSESINMNLGKVAQLEADLTCAKLLMKQSKLWHYWINLTGQEVPLKTNWELVTALKILNGSNIVAASYEKRKKRPIVPSDYLDLNITWYKGNDLIAVRPEFVKYVLNNELATLLLDAFRAYEEDFGPNPELEESYFSILNNNPFVFPIPGSFLNAHEFTRIEAPVLAEIRPFYNWPCTTRIWERGVCLLGADDMLYLKSHPHFFAGNFAQKTKDQTIAGLEKWHWEKRRYEVRHGRLHPSFDREHYIQMDIRLNHL